MDDKFNLIKTQDSLESIEKRTGNTKYINIAPSRDLRDTADEKKYSQGTIRYDWSAGNNQYIDPESIRLVTDVEVTKGDSSTQLEVADNLGLAPGLSANLFENMEFYMNDVLIDQCNYPAEINSMITRAEKNCCWIGGGGQGAVYDNWVPSLSQRIANVSSDGASGGGAGGIVPVSGGETTIPRLEITGRCRIYICRGK